MAKSKKSKKIKSIGQMFLRNNITQKHNKIMSYWFYFFTFENYTSMTHDCYIMSPGTSVPQGIAIARVYRLSVF